MILQICKFTKREMTLCCRCYRTGDRYNQHECTITYIKPAHIAQIHPYELAKVSLHLDLYGLLDWSCYVNATIDIWTWSIPWCTSHQLEWNLGQCLHIERHDAIKLDHTMVRPIQVRSSFTWHRHLADGSIISFALLNFFLCAHMFFHHCTKFMSKLKSLKWEDPMNFLTANYLLS